MLPTDWLNLHHVYHGCGFYKFLREVRFFTGRSGFDFDGEAFRVNTNLNKFKEIGCIGLIRCLILNLHTICQVT